MGRRPTIRLCSHDAQRQRGSSKLGVVVGLGPARTIRRRRLCSAERGETGSWAALTLLLFVLPAVEVARFRASFGLWVR